LEVLYLSAFTLPGFGATSAHRTFLRAGPERIRPLARIMRAGGSPAAPLTAP